MRWLAISLGMCGLLLCSLACPANKSGPVTDKPVFLSTIPPLTSILRNLAGERAEVIGILQTGASPHSFEPVPSQFRAAEGALALFYIADILDGWATRLPCEDRVEVMALVPPNLMLPAIGRHDHGGGSHEHGEYDPHIWSDPGLMARIVPLLADEMARVDPAGESSYRDTVEDYVRELEALDQEITAQLAPIRGERVVMFHPSYQYFCTKYRIEIAAFIEPIPGKEPSPKDLAKMVTALRENPAGAIFTEPQLPKRPAEVLAEETKLPLVEFDPLGTHDSAGGYTMLLRTNAQLFLEALSQ